MLAEGDQGDHLGGHINLGFDRLGRHWLPRDASLQERHHDARLSMQPARDFDQRGGDE